MVVGIYCCNNRCNCLFNNFLIEAFIARLSGSTTFLSAFIVFLNALFLGNNCASLLSLFFSRSMIRFFRILFQWITDFVFINFDWKFFSIRKNLVVFYQTTVEATSVLLLVTVPRIHIFPSYFFIHSLCDFNEITVDCFYPILFVFYFVIVEYNFSQSNN